MKASELLAELRLALDTPITWTVDTTSLAEHKATAYTGVQAQNDGGGWRFVLVEYPSGGFNPVGVRMVEVRGTASRLGVVVNLPDDLASKALERAKIADAWRARR